MVLVKVAFSPEGECEQSIVDLIHSTQNSLDVACYSFTNDNIAQALLDAYSRTVILRIVFDRTQTHGTQATYHDKLEAVGIDIRLYSPKDGIMHDKYTISDNRFIESGSFNFTERAQHHNYENIQIHDDTDLATSYKKDFEKIWALSEKEVSGNLRESIRLARALETTDV